MQDFRRPTHTTSSLGVVNAERGFSMLEVMISMFILATGLFGLIGVQLMAHKSELDSYQRAQALVLLTDIVDRININRKAATCYAVTTTATSASSRMSPDSCADDSMRCPRSCLPIRSLTEGYT